MIRIRKMELEHQQYLAKIQVEQLQKDREFQMMKLKLQQEEQEARLETARLRIKELKETDATNDLKEVLSKPEEVKGKPTQKVKSLPEVPLKEVLLEEFKAIVTDFLEGNECDWSSGDIKNMISSIKEWQKQMRDWAKRRDIYCFSYPQWEMMNEVKETLKEMEDELAKGSFWDSKEEYLELEQDWMDKLRRALE
jgi:hypothetical protein